MGWWRRLVPGFRRQRGDRAEEAAAAYLRENGYRILERNVHAYRGEVDLLAREGGEVVFVEVRARSGTAYGTAEASVTKTKATRLARAAREILHRRGWSEEPVRLDLAVVDLEEGRPVAVRVLRDALPLGEYLP